MPHVRTASLVMLCLLCACAAQATPAKTGVTGQVLQTPAGPGPTRIGQESDGAPVAALAVQLRDGNGHVVASASTDAAGAFALDAGAGKYTLHADVQGLYPRCPDLPVTVRHGHQSKLVMRCDSGMR